MKKYVLTGASGRGYRMFALPLSSELKDTAKFAGIFDPNRMRAEYISRSCGGLPVYTDFGKMIRETNPDTVIVTTVDAYHDEYIIKSLEAGCDVITEKPMTTTAEKCRAVLKAEKETGRKIYVSFNYRFPPLITKIKEVIYSGRIGNVLKTDLIWTLDRSHGADYFRRWHSVMKNSGGLLVHKSTHHFDIINWWIDDEPETVHGFGGLQVYGPNRRERGERCLTCGYKDSCEFYWDIAADTFTKEFYLDAEGEDGYMRDRCVFSPEIDIYDTMSVQVQYRKGSILSYSLIAYAPHEGWKLSITGTKGRLEADEFMSGFRSREPSRLIRLYFPDPKEPEDILEVPVLRGDHGGGDKRLRDMIFRENTPDPLGHLAGTRAGAMSILIGIGANTSIQEKRPVDIDSMLEER
ncbi:MAG: Gfo/Idh/MocA family protein [Spirochaetia bacterium]